MGWPGAGLWDSCGSTGPRGAQRGPSVRARSCSWPHIHPGVPRGMVPPSLSHSRSLFPHPPCTASPGHSHPVLPCCHHTSNAVPSPLSSHPPTSGLSSPGRVPGGLWPAGSISGDAESGAGLQLCLQLRPPPRLAARRGNHSPYQSVALLTERKQQCWGSFQSTPGRRRPSPAPQHPLAMGGHPTHGMGAKGRCLLSLMSKELGASGEKQP